MAQEVYMATYKERRMKSVLLAALVTALLLGLLIAAISCTTEVVYVTPTPAPIPSGEPIPEWVSSPTGPSLEVTYSDIALTSNYHQVSGGGYRFPKIQSPRTDGTAEVEGRVFLEGGGSKLLVVASAMSTTSSSDLLPNEIFEWAGDMGRDIPRRGSYVWATSGATWILRNQHNYAQDIQIFALGYGQLAFDNVILDCLEGCKVYLPDVYLPKQEIKWKVPPPTGEQWFVRYVLSPY